MTDVTVAAGGTALRGGVTMVAAFVLVAVSGVFGSAVAAAVDGDAEAMCSRKRSKVAGSQQRLLCSTILLG